MTKHLAPQLVSAFSLLCVALTATAMTYSPLSPEAKKAELDQLAHIIKTQYGPKHFKSSQLKTDVDALVAKYAEETKNGTNLEFYYALNRFVAEFKDSHFGSKLNTDHVSRLGFICDRVQGKALLESIDREVLSESDFPYKKGDEVVSIGGVSADELVKQLASHLPSGYEESGLRTATTLLGYRPAAQVPPQVGKVTVEIRRVDTTVTETVELQWKHKGKLLEYETPEGTEIETDNSLRRLDYGVISIADSYAGMPKLEKDMRCNGASRIKMPKGATKLMTEPFVAYYHDTPKGKVGYLRIPHYYWKNAVTEESENDLRFKQYEYVVDELEKNTVALVIDQTHNCGGSVTLVEQMVGLFAQAPYTGLEFQFLASRNEYLHFKTWIDKDAEKTLEGKDLEKVLDLMKEAWTKGDYLSAKTTFANRRLLQPNRITYTKPVLVLIDELSGSGGDAFPAMMQGYGRATLMGKRTMGAGGHVEELSALPYSGNTVRITKSLFYHPNGTPIENFGVSPDIAYDPTRADFMYEYQEYQQAYLKVVSECLLEGRKCTEVPK